MKKEEERVGGQWEEKERKKLEEEKIGDEQLKRGRGGGD